MGSPGHRCEACWWKPAGDRARLLAPSPFYGFGAQHSAGGGGLSAWWYRLRNQVALIGRPSMAITVREVGDRQVVIAFTLT